MKIMILIISLLFFSSCAHVISDQYVQSSVKDVRFGQVAADTSSYMDKVFILGGGIVEVKNTKDGSEIELLQYPVDQRGYIVDTDVSEGRFFAITPRYLDPMIFKKHRKVTLAGRLIGTKKKTIGEVEFDFPVMAVLEIYLWKSVKQAGTYPEPYYPMYYYQYPYYWYDPYWHSPYLSPN